LYYANVIFGVEYSLFDFFSVIFLISLEFC